MDLNALRVFNSLYRLGITEEEFKDIEEEQQHTERTGLSIKAIKKQNLIGISHDQKHDIIIKKTNIDTKPKSRVLFKTLITFEDLPKEVYILHQIAQYRALDTEVKHTANNLEELKDRICDRFADEYPKELGGMYEDVYGCYDEREKNKKSKAELIIKQIKALCWLFGEDYTQFKVDIARKNIPKIIKVFQRNNRRIAIIQINEEWDKQRGGIYRNSWSEHIKRTVLKIRTYLPSDPRFNYVCPDREIYLKEYGNSEIWLADDLNGKITAEELKVLANAEGEWTLLTADRYHKQKSIIRIELINARRKEQEDTAKNQLIKSVEKQFKQGSVTRQGITFTKKNITYEGITITGSRIGEYLIENQIIFLEEPNFNEIIEGYIEFILKLNVIHDYNQNVTGVYCEFEGKDKISIGDIKIILEKIGTNFYINDYKITKADLLEAIKKSLQFNNQIDYNKWLKNTSRINLRLQKALRDKGLKFILRIDRADDNSLTIKSTEMLMSISILRKGNKNYVKIKGKEYRIKNINALFDLGKPVSIYTGYLNRTIKLICRAIEGITPKDIGNLIRTGKKEYREMANRLEKEKQAIIKRSKEFLAHAVRITKSIKVKDGYIVKGISGMNYFVNGQDGGVWTTKNKKQDKYLCIVDLGTDLAEGEAGKNDKIVKRLLMLSKDKKVAREIWHNGDKMDRWWSEIQEENKNEAIII